MVFKIFKKYLVNFIFLIVSLIPYYLLMRLWKNKLSYIMTEPIQPLKKKNELPTFWTINILMGEEGRWWAYGGGKCIKTCHVIKNAVRLFWLLHHLFLDYHNSFFLSFLFMSYSVFLWSILYITAKLILHKYIPW